MKIIKALSVTALILWSTASSAAYLTDQWDHDGYTYCEYTDGTIKRVNGGCPSSI